MILCKRFPLAMRDTLPLSVLSLLGTGTGKGGGLPSLLLPPAPPLHPTPSQCSHYRLSWPDNIPDPWALRGCAGWGVLSLPGPATLPPLEIPGRAMNEHISNAISIL